MKKFHGRITDKIRQRAAFTLSETLVAMLILLLVSSIVVAGIPAATRAYDNVVIASNAEVLLSTTMSSLRNELSTAKAIKIATDGTTITYYNEAIGARSKIYLDPASDSDEDTDTIMYKMYAASSDGVDPERLVSKEASDSRMDLHVVYSGVEYSNGIIKFTGLKVTKKDGTETPAKLDTTYSIRVITYSHIKSADI